MTLLADLNPFRYRMYLFDFEAKMYNCENRFYSMDLSRFISLDSKSGISRGQYLISLFAYCNNSPITKVDKNGSLSRCAVCDLYQFNTASARLTLLSSVSQNKYGAAPQYKPFEETNNPDEFVNCYAYVLGMYDQSIDPGYFSNTPKEAYWKGNVEKLYFVVSLDLMELGYGCRRLDDFDSPIAENEYRVAMCVGGPKWREDSDGSNHLRWDYHFMVQTDTGLWAEKQGKNGRSKLHLTGNPSNTIWCSDYLPGFYDSNSEDSIIYIAIGRGNG